MWTEDLDNALELCQNKILLPQLPYVQTPDQLYFSPIHSIINVQSLNLNERYKRLKKNMSNSRKAYD